MAYGSSQARGRIAAVATGLRQSHSNADPSLVCNLHHSSRQHRILNPLSEARDQTCNLTVPSRIHFCCSELPSIILCFCLFVCFVFCLFAISWAASAAYGGSQARGRIGAVATGLRQSHSNQSHSNAGSEPRLQPTPQLTAMPDP